MDEYSYWRNVEAEFKARMEQENNMTTEITLKEACDEINRLNRERDALKAQVEVGKTCFDHVQKFLKALSTDSIDEGLERIAALKAQLENQQKRADAYARSWKEIVDIAACFKTALEKVEEWMSRAEDGYAVFDHWGDEVIGHWDDNEWDWQTTLASVRDLTIPLEDLTHEPRLWQLEEIMLYREILAALHQERKICTTTTQEN